MKKKIMLVSAVLFLLISFLLLANFLKNKVSADTVNSAYPLPYMANWTGHVHPMLLLAQRGHAVIPTLPSDAGPNFGEYEVKDLIAIKNLGLPVDMTGTQWENALRGAPYVNIDRNATTNTFTGTTGMSSANPNNIYTNNSFSDPILDPLGPTAQVDLWRELGINYSSLPGFLFMQDAYPNPPKVRLTGNNEAGKMRGYKLPTESKRFNELYPDLSQYIPADASFDWKRLYFENRVAGDGWIERYKALFQAWRDNTVNPIWKNIKFTAYWGILQGNFRAYNYANYATGTSTISSYEEGPLPDTNNTVPRTSYYPFAWDGASPHVMLSLNEDTKLQGFNFDAMNYLFMIEEGKQANPDYEFELSTWDKNYSSITPERYAGAMQYQFWLLRPRAIREFRSDAPWTTYLDKFLALTKVVDRVHRLPILTDFWQNGELVENPVGRHPYQANAGQAMIDGFTDDQIRERYGVGRWFHLYSNFDQPYLTDNGGFPAFDLYRASTNPEIKVSSIAMVKGSEPNREWVMYTYSPLENRTGVEVTLPGFGQVPNLNSTIGGNFYYIKESDKTVTEITDAPAALTHLLLNHENPIVAPGAQMQFAITGGKDQYDADVTVDSVSWTITGGTIDANGLFTAGDTPGKYKLTATSGDVSESFDLEVGNLLAYWKFDEGKGFYAADSSGRNNGCFNQSGWQDNGKFSKAVKTAESWATVHCDSDEYMEAPNGLTISAWINPGSSYDNGGYIGGIYADDLKSGYVLSIGNNATTGPELMFVGLRANSLNIPLNKWTHVATEYKAGEYIRIFVDGAKVKEQTTNVPANLTRGFDRFRVGQMYSGSIDQFRLYNQALSVTEIEALFNEIPSSDPNLTLTKTVDKTNIQAGGTLNYTITYQNISNNPLTDTVITDVLSDRLTLVSAPGAEINGQNLTWTIPSIPANSSPQTLEIQCIVNSP